MKPSGCDDCGYLDEVMSEQPCCGCVSGLLFEPSEDSSSGATSNMREGATLNAHSNCETIYREADGSCLGCNACIQSVDAWEADECFPEKE